MLIEANQIWRDNDPRNRNRLVRIQQVDSRYAYCLSERTVRGAVKTRRVRIELSRFNPNRKNGYSFLNEHDKT